MENNFEKIKELLTEKAEIQARLKNILYDGRPEVKQKGSGKYLYIRKTEGGRQTSSYVDKYSDALFDALQRYWKERKTLEKQLRQVEIKLAELGYREAELSADILKNLEFARINMKSNIYEQAILEGVATTFSDTETIIENGKVSNMKPSDIQKILNLKHAWEFIMDKDVIQAKTDFYLLSHIAKLVNEGFFEQGGKIRSVPVSIGHSSYLPPIPIESVIKENIAEIISGKKDDVDIAIDLCLYCMKAQIFNDGNKRAAVIFANHYLIGKGKGLIVIPEKDVPKFKLLLVDFYEDKDRNKIHKFMKDKCWRKM